MSDKGLAHLKGVPNLAEISLSSTKISDKGLAHLRGVPNLKFLTVDETKITQKGIDDLRKTFPNLSVIGLK